MLQRVLAEPEWMARMTLADRRSLTPLLWGHVSPNGTFSLHMDTRLDMNSGKPHERGVTRRTGPHAAAANLASGFANRPMLASPHAFKEASTGSRLRPSGDRLYSTLGGTWA